MHRGVPRRLHLRGRAHALHTPRRMRGLRRMRAGLPGRGDLLRGRRARPVEGLLQGQRGVLHRAGLAGRRVEGREDQQGPPGRRRAAAAGRRQLTTATRLPRFPWDLLAPYAEKARAHNAGIVDLSVGTPVDPVPAIVKAALSAAADSPGYPAVHGQTGLREAAADWLARSHGVRVDPGAVLPVIGTKEFIA